MPRLKSEKFTLHDGATSTTDGSVMRVGEYRHVVVAVSAALNSSLTFKFKGTFDGDADITAAQTVTNIWDYVGAYDLEDSSTFIDGDTGVTIDNDSVANNTRQYIVNTEFIEEFTVEISAYTDGTFYAYAWGVNDMA